MPVKTITFGVSTTVSAALPLHLLCQAFLPLHVLALYLCASLPLSFLMLSLLQGFAVIYKVLAFIFSGVMHLPTLPSFICSHQTGMGQYFSQLSIHVFYLGSASVPLVPVFALCPCTPYFYSAHSSVSSVSAR